MRTRRPLWYCSRRRAPRCYSITECATVGWPTAAKRHARCYTSPSPRQTTRTRYASGACTARQPVSRYRRCTYLAQHYVRSCGALGKFLFATLPQAPEASDGRGPDRASRTAVERELVRPTRTRALAGSPEFALSNGQRRLSDNPTRLSRPTSARYLARTWKQNIPAGAPGHRSCAGYYDCTRR